MEIRLSVRDNDLSRKSLLDMLQGVFSDEDTNGENGEEYYRLSSEMCDDDFLRQTYSNESISEEVVIKEYADYYMSTMSVYCERWQDYSTKCNSEGKVIAISYAYY